MFRVWWHFTLLITALGLVMGGAHVLELPIRMQYDPEFYMRVTSTLYPYFGFVGGPIQVVAILAAGVLTWMVREHVAFRTTLAGTACLGLSLGLWFLLVQPVNAAWAEALQASPADAVQAYAQLRSRWEYGHVAAFIAWCLGFALLLNGVVREAIQPSRLER
ncbi:DUF1772 domain-containing protein [Billgrantia tianxiuensis]|uniref:DUF1772 domain-containing protein n=1 Tax=Billgrantia tianxiuensis TaxID=2497861 RepID=A0A6I6SQE9_9GAMM|nr:MULTISPECIES: hypothetical protein [Halomonas]MCE8032207.1 hypothetical protein [Halomonas sp. MCCC 1A11057]QHC49777.1 DUF1772 domain-containing protein [Halomonas tianxiuensis]